MIVSCSRSRMACDAYGVSNNPDTKDKATYQTFASPTFSDSVYSNHSEAPQLQEVQIASRSAKVKEDSKKAEFEYNEASSSTANTRSAVSLDQLNKNISVQNTQRTPLAPAQAQMNSEVKKLATTSAESFDYNLYMYVSGNYDVTRFNYLKKAEALNPQDKEVIAQLAAHYMCVNDQKLALAYLENWKNGLSAQKLDVDYAPDALLSVEENGVLIVHGIMDSYSALWQQLHNSMRPDVQVISLELLQSQSYRKSLSEKGYNLPLNNIVDKSFLTQFCRMNSDRNISLALTIPKEYLTDMVTNLYTVGLTFRYASQPGFDNFYRNELLWDKQLLKTPFIRIKAEKRNVDMDNSLLSNYLPMLFQMRGVYVQQENVQKINELDNYINTIGTLTGKMELIEKIRQEQK